MKKFITGVVAFAAIVALPFAAFSYEGALLSDSGTVIVDADLILTGPGRAVADAKVAGGFEYIIPCDDYCSASIGRAVADAKVAGQRYFMMKPIAVADAKVAGAESIAVSSPSGALVAADGRVILDLNASK